MVGCDGYVRKPKVTKLTAIGGAHVKMDTSYDVPHK
jgi:hypothetical protein